MKKILIALGMLSMIGSAHASEMPRDLAAVASIYHTDTKCHGLLKKAGIKVKKKKFAELFYKVEKKYGEDRVLEAVREAKKGFDDVLLKPMACGLTLILLSEFFMKTKNFLEEK